MRVGLKRPRGERSCTLTEDVQKVRSAFRLSGIGHWPLFPTIVLAALVFAALFAPYLAPP